VIIAHPVSGEMAADLYLCPAVGRGRCSAPNGLSALP